MDFKKVCSSSFNSLLYDQKKRNICTNSDHRLWQFFKQYDCRDKLFKLGDTLFDIGQVTAEWTGASDKTLADIKNGRTWAKISRDGMGMFNIFAGALAALGANISAVSRLAFNLSGSNDGSVILKYDRQNISAAAKKYNAKARTKPQKILAIVVNIFKALGVVAYIIAFGLCRPIVNLQKHAKIEMGKSLQEIGKGFQGIMTLNHIFSIVGNVGEMVFNSMAYNHVLQKDNHYGLDISKMHSDYAKNLAKNTAGNLEKSLELINDILYFAGESAPHPAFRIPVNLGIGLLGIYSKVIELE